MHVFDSPAGDGPLYFENLVTPGGAAVAFDPVSRAFTSTAPFCANRARIGCNWVALAPGEICAACAMTALVPDVATGADTENWARTETAKRWVLVNLQRWGWCRPDDAGPHPVFHILAEGQTPVVMGHADGVVTISIAESDPVTRVTRQEALDESYRTMIGHMRHELAHYLWWRLSVMPGFLDEFRGLFGDERADYAAALDRHYASGPREGWRDHYLTPYASAHPHEDWAETAAHLLHLVDIFDSVLAVDLSAPGAPGRGWDPYLEEDAEGLVTMAAELAIRINHVNRSMGLPDLYPFVLTELPRRKLAFVHRWLRRGPSAGPPARPGAGRLPA